MRNDYFRRISLKTILIAAGVLLCLVSVASFLYCSIQDRREAEQEKKQ